MALGIMPIWYGLGGKQAVDGTRSPGVKEREEPGLGGLKWSPSQYLWMGVDKDPSLMASKIIP